MMLEMDGGAFPPSRIMVGNKNDSVLAMLQIFNPLLHEIDDSLNVVPGWGGVDIGPMSRQNNIPCLGLGTNGEGKYFWYHHGPSDTVDKIDPKVFNQCIAAIAVTIYLYANL
jgi:carboxypeptidase Q